MAIFGGFFSMAATRILRSDSLAVGNYLNALAEEDYSIPSDGTLRCISQCIDASAKRIFQETNEILIEDRTIRLAIKRLKEQPRLCKGFDREKAILPHLTAFEQMGALSLWVKNEGHQMVKTHTFALAASDDQFIPVWIKPPKTKPLSSMHIVLGNSRGAYKMPKYTKWSEEDPQENSYQAVFIDPLNSLEIHRQPHCIGSLLLKANPYERQSIDHTWRFRVYENKDFARVASVEFPNQTKLSAKASAIKAQSASYNLAKMIQKDRLREENLLPDLFYENYFDDGYSDDAIPTVTPLSLAQTLPEALKGNTQPLDQQMAQLFTARLKISAIPAIKTLAAKNLFL